MKGLVLAVALLLLGTGIAYAQSDKMAPRPVQGSSRTVSMEDLCGKCQVEKWTTCGNSIEGPVFDAAGNLYVTSLDTGNIDKITPDKQCSHFANTGGQPQGLKIHNGTMYGVDRKRGVFTIDMQTAEVKDYMRYFLNENFTGPNDLIFDQNDGLYFTDAWGTSPLNPRGSVYYISKDKVITRLINSLSFPNGISLSPDNKTLYIDDFSAQRVLAVPVAAPGVLNLGFAHILANFSGGWGPDSMCVDAKGDVYAAHFGAREVVALDPDGFIIGTIDLPNDAGPRSNNCAFKDGYLYITEGLKNEIWRVKMNVEGVKLN